MASLFSSHRSFVELIPWATSLYFLFSVPVRLYDLHRENVKVKDGSHARSKAILTGLFFFFNLCAIDPEHPQFYETWGILQVIASIELCILSPIEHRRSVRPSSLITCFLLGFNLYCLIEIALESLYRCPLFLPSRLLCALALLLVESRSKVSVLKEEYRSLRPEAVAGSLNRALFWWINSIISQGRTKLFALRDLPGLPNDMSSNSLRQSALVTLEKHRNEYPDSWLTLPSVLLHALYVPFFSAIPYRIALIVFRYAQPILISMAIDFAKSPSWADESSLDGRWIILMTVITYVGLAASESLYRNQLNKLKVMIRGSIVGLIDHKILLTDSVVVEKEKGKIIALMSNDVDNLDTTGEMVHEAWAQTLEVVVGMYFLVDQAGWISLILFVCIYGCSRVSKYVATYLQPKQKEWSEATQERMAMITSLLSHIKIVKMTGATKNLVAKINSLRDWEIDRSKKVRWVMVNYNISANALGILSPVIVIALSAIISKSWDERSSLDAKTAFTSIALLTLVTHPANMVMTVVPRIIASLTGFERIQSFLLEPTMKDSRKTISGPAESSTKAAIRLADASINYLSAPSPTLQSASLDLAPGSITFCLGAIGAGKSTLVRAILGDSVQVSSTVKISTKRIGVYTQVPWLPSGTIQNAICGMAEADIFSLEWYNKVIQACCLDQDLKTLPDSDQTEVGYCGQNLSGGQLQRVALARAIYSRNRLLLLDEPFSALDSETEERVINNLFGADGLLRRSRITCFVIVKNMKTLSLADNVVVVENGKTKPINQLDTVAIDRSQSSTPSQTVRQNQPNSELVDKISKLRLQSEAIKEVSTDDAKGYSRDLDLYLYYLNAVGSLNLWLALFFTSTYAFFVTIPQYWLKLWTDADGENSWFYVGGYILLSVIAWASTCAGMWCISLRVAPRSGKILHDSLLKTTVGATSSFFFETDNSVTINRFGQDIQMIDKELPGALNFLAVQVFKLIMQVALLLYAQMRLIVILPICGTILFFIQKFYLQTSRQLRLLELESRAGVYLSFLETINGLTIIRAFGWQMESANQTSRRLDDSQKPYYLLLCLQRWLNIVLDLLVAGVAVTFITLFITLRGTSSQVGIALNVVLVVNSTLVKLVGSWTTVEISLGAVARLKTFEEDTRQEGTPEETVKPLDSWPWSGNVEICDVEVAYNSRSLALADLSLNIRAGEKAIVCGRTGSGKSTILLTLLRLLDLRKGSIYIDGVDLAIVPRDIIRERCFITLPQEALVFSTLSLRFNVDQDEEYSDEQIVNVLNRAGIWSHLSSWTSDEPHDSALRDYNTFGSGLEKHVGILNTPLYDLPPLSSGQTQLLSLSRAILKSLNPKNSQLGSARRPILLVDEATSSLDQETESKVHDLVDEFFTNRGFTVIMITHRVEAATKSMRPGTDRVIKMENGRVKEEE